jgi:hypothetical protein
MLYGVLIYLAQSQPDNTGYNIFLVCCIIPIGAIVLFGIWSGMDGYYKRMDAQKRFYDKYK